MEAWIDPAKNEVVLRERTIPLPERVRVLIDEARSRRALAGLTIANAGSSIRETIVDAIATSFPADAVEMLVESDLLLSIRKPKAYSRSCIPMG